DPGLKQREDRGAEESRSDQVARSVGRRQQAIGRNRLLMIYPADCFLHTADYFSTNQPIN
ncbi:MAG: hypothetical protein AABZ69_03215, partial [Candidatus Binatota bacterium]